jgi:hypothetical protein
LLDSIEKPAVFLGKADSRPHVTVVHAFEGAAVPNEDPFREKKVSLQATYRGTVVGKLS